MSTLLKQLIAEASSLANDHPCTHGHIWVSLGARHCEDCGLSKAVFECSRCGDCDYGDRLECGSECEAEKRQYAQIKADESEWWMD